MRYKIRGCSIRHDLGLRIAHHVTRRDYLLLPGGTGTPMRYYITSRLHITSTLGTSQFQGWKCPCLHRDEAPLRLRYTVKGLRCLLDDPSPNVLSAPICCRFALRLERGSDRLPLQHTGTNTRLNRVSDIPLWEEDGYHHAVGSMCGRAICRYSIYAGTSNWLRR